MRILSCVNIALFLGACGLVFSLRGPRMSLGRRVLAGLDAGIYPAMLAVVVAPTAGIDPLSIGFILSLVGIIAISFFGIAGVGGGATYAALVVLPAMGLPVAIVALLISIEPLIDMARTALNVIGAITSGMVTKRLLKVAA